MDETQKTRVPRKVWDVAILTGLVVLVDQLSKFLWANEASKEFALGAGGGGVTTLAKVAGVIMISALAWLLWYLDAPWWVMGLTLGGAISNNLDRLFGQGVRDFIPLDPTDTLTSLIYNVADAALAIGLGYLIVKVVTLGWRETRAILHTSRGGDTC